MTVCGADVRLVDCVRDLGVLIDSNMALSNHINNVAVIRFHQLSEVTYHPTVPDDRCCTLAGSGPDPHPN